MRRENASLRASFPDTQTGDGCLVSKMNEQKDRCAECFEQLYSMADLPNAIFLLLGFRWWILIPPSTKIHPFLMRSESMLQGWVVKRLLESVILVRSCLKLEVRIQMLHAFLVAVWQSGTNLPYWKRGLVPYLEMERWPPGPQLPWQNVAQRARQCSCPSNAHANWQPAAEAAGTWAVRFIAW